MLGMGWQEILLILVVAVLVIGPDQLPQVARTIGRTITQFRRLTNELRDTVNREFTENEDFKEFREFRRTIDGEFRDVGKMAQSYIEKEMASEEAELTQFAEDVRNVGKELKQEGEQALDAGKEALQADTAGHDAEPAAKADDASGNGAAPDAEPVKARSGFEPPADSYAYAPDKPEAAAAPAASPAEASHAEAEHSAETDGEAASDASARKETA